MKTNQSNIVEIISKPNKRYEFSLTETLSNAQGQQFDQKITYLDLNHKNEVITVWWASRTSPEPIYLEENKIYKFIIKLDNEGGNHRILKIWDKEKLIWNNNESNGSLEEKGVGSLLLTD